MRRAFVALLLVALVLGCTEPTGGAVAEVNAMEAKTGDIVKVDYVGTLDDGTVFDTSVKEEAEKGGLPLRPSYEPLEFEVGTGQMIAGFDAGVVGMKEGETKDIHIEAKDAYGEPNPELVVEADTAELKKAGIVPAVGMKLYNGPRQGTIITTDDAKTRIDFNHPMAGKALNFKITMVSIARK